MSPLKSGVGLVDVTLRDGLQMLKQIVPTPAKIELLAALAAAGIRRAEVGSFVNPKLLPQFSDTAELIAAARQLPELSSCVLVPNRRGLDLALKHAPDEIVIVISASEAHNKSNINRTVEQSLAELAPVLVDGRLAGVHMRLAIATAFHCPFEGAISHDKVFRVLDAAVETGALTEAVLCDTIGHAWPHEAEALTTAAIHRYPGVTIGLHAHDTRARGVANAQAAVAAGASVLDGALAGLGGCPYAPGASGNVATAAIASAMSRSGHVTGVNEMQLARATALASVFEQPSPAPIGVDLTSA